MRYFLAKTDPETYSIEMLSKEKNTIWDGVHSHAAIRYIKEWKIGDVVFLYHSGGESKIVGYMTVNGEPYKDEKDPQGISWVANVAFAAQFPEESYISLKEIKQSGLFSEFILVRQGRLSTMSCPDAFVKWLREKGLQFP